MPASHTVSFDASTTSSASSLATPPARAVPSLGLKHGSYTCPGLHGPGSRQDIRPVALGNFLDPGQPALMIPLFQRRYCWGERVIKRWWADLCPSQPASRAHPGGKREPASSLEANTLQNRNGWDPQRIGDAARHRVGRAVFKALPGGLVCIIDGQQRLTTALLLIAAVRDAALQLGDADVVDHCDAALFRDLDAWRQWKLAKGCGWQPFARGERLSFATLTPSFADRAAFFDLMTFGAVDGAEMSSLTKDSLQGKAYTHFANGIRSVLGPSNDGLGALRRLARAALDGVTIMRVDIINEINFGQVFLWLQEKSLFGSGALLFNPTPGENFTAADLVRNQLMSGFMGRSLREQEDEFQRLWIDPIETPCGSPRVIEQALALWVNGRAGMELSPTTFETQMAQMEASGIAQFKPSASVKLYARFVTHYEHLTGPEPSVETMERVARDVAGALAECAAISAGPGVEGQLALRQHGKNQVRREMAKKMDLTE